MAVRKVIVKDKLWPKVRYNPHPGQRRVHAAGQRHRVNAAGRRFGKSQVGGHELTIGAMEAYARRGMLEDLGIRQEYWIVGPNYTDSEKEFRVLFSDIKRMGLPMDHPGTYYDSRSGNMVLSLWQGRYLVQAKSAAKPESLVGEGLHGVVMAEAAKMKGSVWSKYVRPTLADFTGWSLWNSTPEGKNHFYDMWELGQSPDSPDWWSARSPSWENSFVFKKGMTPAQLKCLKSMEPGEGPVMALKLGADPEIVDMFVELGPTMFGQEVECSFTEYAGLVYADFDEEVHVRKLHFDPALPLYIATDYGFTNPNVALFIQVDNDDNVYIIAEFYRAGLTEDEFADEVLQDSRLSPLVNHARTLYPDPEDPGATKTLSVKWKVSAQGGTGGPLKNRINAIRKWLIIQHPHLPFGHVDRQPKLFVDRSCANLRRELLAYRYPKDEKERAGNAPENPLKKDDHAPEALSRFFAGRFQTAVRGKTTVRKARIGGG